MKIRPLYKVVLALVVIAVIAILAASYYLSPIVRSIAVKRLSGMGIDAEIEDMDLGLLRGVAGVSGVKMALTEGEEFLSLGEATVNMDLIGAAFGQRDIQSISARDGKANLRFDSAGQLQLLALLSAAGTSDATATAGEKEGPGFSLGNLKIENMEITIQDDRPDTPIRSAYLKAKESRVDLNRGRIILKGIELNADGQPSQLNLGSAELETNMKFPPPGKIYIAKADLNTLRGHVHMTENGKPLIQEWVMGLMQANNLAGQKASTGKEASAEETWQDLLPAQTYLEDIQLEVSYPAPGGQTWMESIELASLKLNKESSDLEVSSLVWNTDRDQLKDEPVAKADAIEASLDISKEPMVAEDLEIESVSLALVKPAGGDYGTLERITHLMELVSSSKAPEMETSGASQGKRGIQFKGKARLNSFKGRVLTLAGDNRTDNILSLDSVELDLSKGSLKLSRILLSDENGNLQKPSVDIPMITARGNFAYPLPDPLEIENINIQKPVIRASRSQEKEIDLLQRVKALAPGEDEPQADPGGQQEKAPVHIRIRQGLVEEADIIFVDHLEADRPVTYDLKPARISLNDFEYPGGGQEWSTLEMSSDFSSPAEGDFKMNSRFLKKNFPDNFESSVNLQLADVTQLKPYYEKRFPVQILSGQLSFEAKGQAEQGQLDIPYSLKILSPELAPKKEAGLNVFQGLSNAGAQTLANSLKNQEGNLAYSGRISGTLEKPSFTSPWKAAGQLLNNNIKKNLAILPELLKSPQGVVEGAAKTATEGVKGVGEGLKDVGSTIQGILGGGKKEKTPAAQPTP